MTWPARREPAKLESRRGSPSLRRQLDTLAGDEERLTTASQRLQARVELFRVQKETIKASYTAAEATRMAQEAFAGIGVDVSDLADHGRGGGRHVRHRRRRNRRR